MEGGVIFDPGGVIFDGGGVRDDSQEGGSTGDELCLTSWTCYLPIEQITETNHVNERKNNCETEIVITKLNDSEFISDTELFKMSDNIDNDSVRRVLDKELNNLETNETGQQGQQGQLGQQGNGGNEMDVDGNGGNNNVDGESAGNRQNQVSLGI